MLQHWGENKRTPLKCAELIVERGAMLVSIAMVVAQVVLFVRAW